MIKLLTFVRKQDSMILDTCTLKENIFTTRHKFSSFKFALHLLESVVYTFLRLIHLNFNACFELHLFRTLFMFEAFCHWPYSNCTGLKKILKSIRINQSNRYSILYVADVY